MQSVIVRDPSFIIYPDIQGVGSLDYFLGCKSIGG
jgi:hypothetical protein